jgi:hypothetical protein
MTPHRRVAYLTLGLAWPALALAYRPFDSTDAEVAKPRELEIELGPVHRLREGSRRFLQAPALIANLGLSGDRELVLEGRRELALDPEAGEPRSALVDNGAFIKQVLKRGVLQDEPGMSFAMEYGVLLPSVHGDGGTGISLAGIASQRWNAGTIHLNAVLARTRKHQADAFLGAIVEGPYSWSVRPVAEVFTDRVQGSARVNSTLVGAIWRVREGLSFDLGRRSAQAAGEPVREVRAGLTFALSFH